MKNLIILMTFIFSTNILAQNELGKSKLFLRVFDLNGTKIGKGKLLSIYDGTIQLYSKKETLTISVSDIGSIKTKRSGGHNFLVGASSGIVAGIILGSLNPPSESSGGTFTWAGGSSGEELSSGVAVGIISGTIVGGISALFKNSKTYEINGDKQKLKVLKSTLRNINMQ